MPQLPCLEFNNPRPHAAVRLLCLPYAGAGASAYRAWPGRMPEALGVCAVQPPGRETRLDEPLRGRLDDLTEDLCAALLPYLDRPFAVFGHSLGALVGYEFIRRLDREYGKRPVHFFASGFRAPHSAPTREALYRLSDAELMTYLSRLNGIPQVVLDEPELAKAMLRVTRADLEVVDTYRFDAALGRLQCPITVFGGTSDPTVSEERLRAWSELGDGPFRIRLFAGDHFYLIPKVAELIGEIAQELVGGT